MIKINAKRTYKIKKYLDYFYESQIERFQREQNKTKTLARLFLWKLN